MKRVLKLVVLLIMLSPLCVLAATNFDKYDLIITGEGKIDEQSLNGKIVFEILKRYNKKTLLLCGVSTISHDNLYSIVPSITDANNSMKRVSYYYKKLLESIKL